MSASDIERDLIERAFEVAGNSYSPYSHYKVGAALLAKDGRVFCGTNVENASYGLTNCAERSAIFAAVADGCREFEALAVVAFGDSVPSPCGACRQVMAEFCSADFRVIIAVRGDSGERMEDYTLGELLPHSFSL